MCSWIGNAGDGGERGGFLAIDDRGMGLMRGGCGCGCGCGGDGEGGGVGLVTGGGVWEW